MGNVRRKGMLRLGFKEREKAKRTFRNAALILCIVLLFPDISLAKCESVTMYVVSM